MFVMQVAMFLSLPAAQDTSVVSPIVTVLVLAPLPFLYESASPSLLHNNCQLFFLAMCLPFVKTVIIMVVGTSSILLSFHSCACHTEGLGARFLVGIELVTVNTYLSSV